MDKNNQYFEPEWAVHPGEILKEKLAEVKMSFEEFSAQIGKPERALLDVIEGTASVSPELADSFETVLGIPASFWLDLQRDYDIRKVTT